MLVYFSLDLAIALLLLLSAGLTYLIYRRMCETKTKYALQTAFITSITFGELVSITIKIKDIPHMLYRGGLINSEMLIKLNRNIKKGLWERLRLVLNNKNMRIVGTLSPKNTVLLKSAYPPRRNYYDYDYHKHPLRDIMKRCRSIWSN